MPPALDAPPTVSAILTMVTLAGLFATWLDAQARVLRERRLAARAAVQQRAHEAPLAPGRTVVLGTVEVAEGEALAARVEIDQGGSERDNSGTYTFKWTEIGRRVEMRPFYLLHASGARVRVEPRGRAMLVDAMDGMIVVTETARTRYAELSPGEEVYAVGRLQRGEDPEAVRTGYRGGRQGWVLRPPRARDLLLSSEPLEQRFRRRAAAASRVGRITVLGTAGALLLSSSYLARVTAGRWTTGQVLDTKCDTDSDGTSCTATVRLADDRTLAISGGAALGEAAVRGSNAVVCDVAAWPSASSIGPGSNVNTGFPLVLVGLGFLAWHRRKALREGAGWNESPLVDEGKGKLAENARTVSQA